MAGLVADERQGGGEGERAEHDLGGGGEGKLEMEARAVAAGALRRLARGIHVVGGEALEVAANRAAKLTRGSRLGGTIRHVAGQGRRRRHEGAVLLALEHHLVLGIVEIGARFQKIEHLEKILSRSHRAKGNLMSGLG